MLYSDDEAIGLDTKRRVEYGYVALEPTAMISYKAAAKSDVNDKYGLSGRSAARLLRMNDLVRESEEKPDSGETESGGSSTVVLCARGLAEAVTKVDKPIGKDMAVKTREEGKTAADDYDVTIMSRNNGHIWYIHNPDYQGEGTCIIFHKNKASHPYHQHGKTNTLRQAVRGIHKHDRWQMGGRK